MGKASRLPAEMTAFVGRRREMAEVRHLLPVSRMVTLTGVGGVGKTRLALRVAGAVRRAFPDGVWLAEIGDLEEPGLLTGTVLESLGVPGGPGGPLGEMLTAHLRDKHALVLLDGCEHLLEECATVADAVLRSAPAVRILATSRQALGVASERIFTVPAMTLPDGPAGPPVPTPDAVRLFLERAAAVRPAFTPSDADRETIGRICRRLDGIPLAIELAAAHLRTFSLRQLLELLRDPFRLPASGSPAVRTRHRSLRALIDASYAHCTDRERLMWQRASVFRAHLGLEAAEAICADEGITSDAILDLVVGLVDKSVLLREEHLGEVRYRLLETIGRYGRERLTVSGRYEGFLRRHCGWYQDLVHRARVEWFGPEQVRWFTRLRLEHCNIHAALDRCLTEGETRAGLAMATELQFYWIAAGSMREGRRWLDAFLAAGPDSAAVVADAPGVNAWLAVLQSDFATAASMLDRSRALGDRPGAREIIAHASYVDGMSACIRGDLRRAVTFLRDAVGRYREIHHDMGVAASLAYLALAQSLQGRSAAAVGSFEKCLRVCASRNENYFRSYALCFYGIQAWQQGDLARAAELESRSIRLKQAFDDPLGMAICIEVLAWVAAGDGEAERAGRLLGAAREIWRSAACPRFASLAGHHERCAALVRGHLGERGFAAAVRSGAALSPEEAIACALRDRATGGDRAATAPPSPLTRREAEVARLAARGMSNRQIAAELVIAPRTAEAHIEHILAKLGLTSRAQIAAWVAAQDRLTVPRRPAVDHRRRPVPGEPEVDR